MYRSNFPTGIKLTPNADISTIPIMVIIVMTEKAAVTNIRFHRLPRAAGYINRGISGSQGPKTKMVKSIQGVIAVSYTHLRAHET